METSKPIDSESIRSQFYAASASPVTEGDILSPEFLVIHEELLGVLDARMATSSAIKIFKHFRAVDKFVHDL